MRISVITVVRNNRNTICDALESVISQTWRNVEHVVIDGDSTDGTLELLLRYKDRIATLISERDDGIYDALNKGIRLASGDVLGFLHSDDTFASERSLELIATAFATSPVDSVYGDLAYVRRSDPTQVVRLWRAGDYSRRKLAWGWMPPHPTLYVRRDVYRRLGPFDTRYRVAGDYDCILRFLGKGSISTRYIPEVLVNMRLGGVSNNSIASILRKVAEDYRALRDNRVGAVGALLWKNVSKVPQFLIRS